MALRHRVRDNGLEDSDEVTVTVLDYDERGNVTSLTNLLLETSTWDHEANKLSDTDRLGRVTRYRHDALNRLVETMYPDNTSIQAEYDAAGRVVREIDARGNATVHAYDALDQSTAVTYADGSTTESRYVGRGMTTAALDQNGRESVFSSDLQHRKCLQPDSR